ncbi:aa3-type cytochrome c oxidase subunit IV [Qipengyuania sphaerica]|nr:aa3-type cytochrome c oxidase subunit IV [Qipengyuania sphaerica]MBX7541076.1 aa3-type cytochrome c oxidase subunit IV [Qipengyuania sphaerica]
MESANDRKAHEKTYGSFIAMLKWTIPLLAVITAVVVVLISS